MMFLLAGAHELQLFNGERGELGPTVAGSAIQYGDTESFVGSNVVLFNLIPSGFSTFRL